MAERREEFEPFVEDDQVCVGDTGGSVFISSPRFLGCAACVVNAVRKGMPFFNVHTNHTPRGLTHT